jgi:tRNA (cmo5U34)-methyltransferase
VSSSNDLQRYRQFHDAVVPGVASLHRMVRAIFDSALPDNARILISGAGGGRELETLGASSRDYQFVGVDPSAKMLDLARLSIEGTDVERRTTLILGTPADAPDEQHDAATSLFVMHFLAADGAKAAYLREIRRRLRDGAPYLHVDVCHDGHAAYERLAAVYAQHAQLGGLSADDARQVAASVAELPIISKRLVRERLNEAGFRIVAPFFQGLWYTGFWTEAA